jgi:AmmeMemoRadiSam system protein B/AmmeMemoRadiSam system protein A
MSTWLRRSIPGAFVLCVLVLACAQTVSCKKATPAKSSAPQVAGAEAKGGRPPVKDVMRSTLAGTWYNADPAALRTEIAGYFEQVKIDPRDDVIGLILPHAGYKYSGRTAAHAIKSLGRSYTRVVVIGPTHHLPMEEMLSVPRATHYQSPLGEIPLDVEFIGRLLTYPIFQDVPSAHTDEHSVQIEVPLLQYKLGEFKLVPIVAGQCTYETVAQAGKILAGLIDKDTLVVASSDFTHYGPQYEYVPFTSDIPENLKKLDMGMFEFITKKDPRGLLEHRRKTGATVCGYVPISILLAMLSDGAEVQLVEYTTSGELMNDYTNSVSYVAAAFHGAWQPSGPPAAQASNGALSQEDKKVLLSLARKTIQYALDKQRVPEPADLRITPSEAIKVPRAAFVTLKKHGELRGCIGDIFPQRPLYKSVITNAIYAAFADRRFTPVQKDECKEIKIEISALTPPSPVASAQAIRIGTDGMVLSKDGHSAVFLPQVAPEQGWDLETTLSNLSMKAGLAPDAWKEGATFQVFQAEVFGEQE